MPKVLLRESLFSTIRSPGVVGVRDEVAHAVVRVADHLALARRRPRASRVSKSGGLTATSVIATSRSIAVVRPAVEKTCWPLISSGRHDVRVAGHRAVVLRLDVRERVALQVQLDRLPPQERERLPGRSRPCRGRSGLSPTVAFGAEVDVVGAAARRSCVSPCSSYCVVLGQPDVERQGRDLLRLEDRELGERLALPLDAVQDRTRPTPSRGACRAGRRRGRGSSGRRSR